MHRSKFILGATLATGMAVAGAPSMQKLNESQSLVRDPAASITIDGKSFEQSELALVEGHAPDSGASIVEIDGQQTYTRKEYAPYTFFLVPGKHTFHLRHLAITAGLFPRKIEYSNTVEIELAAGHTYIPHNFVGSKPKPSAENLLGLVDRGPEFPRQCLTSQFLLESPNGIRTVELKSRFDQCLSAAKVADGLTYRDMSKYP